MSRAVHPISPAHKEMVAGPGPSGEEGRTRIVTVAATLTAVGVGAAFLALLVSGNVWLNHDCALYLECGRSLVDGRVPYVDYVELNPPLVQYLHTIPALLARVSGLHLNTAFQLCVTVLVLYSAVVLWLLLRRDARSSGDVANNTLILAAWLWFTLFVVACLGFGQREHLFMLGCVPWLYCRELRHRGGEPGRPLAFVVGVVAAPLMLLKPHLLAIALVLELWMFYRSRRGRSVLSVEIVIVGAAMVAYAAHFLFVPLGMRQAFFGRWVPFIAANYDVYNCSAETLWAGGRLLKPLGLGVAGLVIARFVGGHEWLRCEVLSLGTLSAIGIYVLQHKGWPYHFFPVAGFSVLLIATATLAILEGVARFAWRRFSRRFGLPAAVFVPICLALAASAVVLSRQTLQLGQDRAERDGSFVGLIQACSAPGERVMFISTDVDPAYPALILADRLPGSRYFCAFPIAMLYRGVPLGESGSFPYREPDQWSFEERRFLEELGEDVVRNRPALVFVDAHKSATACPKGFSIDEYLRRSGWRARFMAGYRLHSVLGGYAVYQRQ